MSDDNDKVKTTECSVGDMVYTIYAGINNTFDPASCSFFYVTKYKVIAPEWSLCARRNSQRHFQFRETCCH